MSYTCDFCLSESESVSAMLACEEQCAEGDRNTRGYFGRHNPNHRD